MHIRQTIAIEAPPDRVMEIVRTWMRGELRDLGGEIIDGVSAHGAPSITSAIDQDCIRMTTSLTVSAHNTGSKLTLDLRTRGIDLGAKIRNVSLLPGRKLVTGQARASLQEIKASAER